MGFETVTHEGERVVFVPNLDLSSTRVPDAEFWDVMDFYESKLSPLKKKFAMELIILSWILVYGSNGVKPAKIPSSAIGQHWKKNIQYYDFWKEIPIHLVVEMQESTLKLAEMRGFCGLSSEDLVDFSKWLARIQSIQYYLKLLPYCSILFFVFFTRVRVRNPSSPGPIRLDETRVRAHQLIPLGAPEIHTEIPQRSADPPRQEPDLRTQLRPRVTAIIG
jgi:hypothetical protein